MLMTVFLPCRRGSERIPNKNTKDFAGVKGGLLKIKLDQLTRLSTVDSIVVSSNDEIVLDFATTYTDSRIFIDERPEHLGSSSTSTDELIKYVPSIITTGHVLWTHVTSPFLDEFGYEAIIQQYIEALTQGFDSLMTVKELKGFIWNKDKPLSYDRNIEKWPRTQSIQPLYEIDSSVFLSSIEQYISLNDRIGLKPSKFIQDAESSIDIDCPHDFTYAESTWKAKLARES